MSFAYTGDGFWTAPAAFDFGQRQGQIVRLLGFAYIFCSALVPPLGLKGESVRGPLAMKNVHLL